MLSNVRQLVLKSVVLDMDGGGVVGMSPQEDFEPLFRVASGVGTGARELLSGDPDRIRTDGLHRDRVAC